MIRTKSQKVLPNFGFELKKTDRSHRCAADTNKTLINDLSDRIVYVRENTCTELRLKQVDSKSGATRYLTYSCGTTETFKLFQ